MASPHSKGFVPPANGKAQTLGIPGSGLAVYAEMLAAIEDLLASVPSQLNSCSSEAQRILLQGKSLAWTELKYKLEDRARLQATQAPPPHQVRP